jgi:hypothetical protein
MIVRCVNNVSGLAPTDAQGTASHPDYVHEGLEVGREYAVLGISLYNDRLRFLIDQQKFPPGWLSVAFFELVNSRQPPHWDFQFFNVSGFEPHERRAFQAVWGYGELVRDVDIHTYALREGIPMSLQVFRRELELAGFIPGSYVRERTVAN